MERLVAPDDSNLFVRFPDALAIDSSGRMWMAWVSQYNTANDSYIGWTSRGQGDGWEAPTYIHQSDTLRYIDSDWLACGGGAIWYAWSTSRSGYADTSTVFACRWDEASHAWGPAMQVSQSDGGYYWWITLAVDKQSRPHVFWCDANREVLWYSSYDGAKWSIPALVDDTEQGAWATPEAAPFVSIDEDGIIHVVYTGYLLPAQHRSIMYTFNDGTGWQPSMRATLGSKDSLYPPWYSSVAALHRNDVWATWDRQGESTDQFRVYASHFDGDSWSRETRLCNDSSYYNCLGVPQIALDGQGEPWVVWDATALNDTDKGSIYYNRLVSTGIAQLPGPAASPSNPSLRVSSGANDAIKVEYDVPARGRVSIAILDQAGRRIATLVDGPAESGSRTTRWDCRSSGGQSVSSGIYFCRLLAGGKALCREFFVIRNQIEKR
jgi:hypothetical protein